MRAEKKATLEMIERKMLSNATSEYLKNMVIFKFHENNLYLWPYNIDNLNSVLPRCQ